MAKWRVPTTLKAGPKPQVGDFVLIVVDDQGIFPSLVLRVEESTLYCQTIPAYCAPGQPLKMLFPVADRLWTVPVQKTRVQPVPQVLSLAIRGPAAKSDPRQHPRYPLAISVLGSFPNGAPLRSLTTDISLSGLGFLADRPLAVGIQLKLTLTSGDSSIDVLAQVVRCESSARHAAYHLALMFINLATCDRDVLSTWIAKSSPPATNCPES